MIPSHWKREADKFFNGKTPVSVLAPILSETDKLVLGSRLYHHYHNGAQQQQAAPVAPSTNGVILPKSVSSNAHVQIGNISTGAVNIPAATTAASLQALSGNCGVVYDQHLSGDAIVYIGNVTTGCLVNLI